MRLDIEISTFLVLVILICFLSMKCSYKSEVNYFADLVLINGKIVTIDEKESIAEAVAVKFGKIIFVEIIRNQKIKKITIILPLIILP